MFGCGFIFLGDLKIFIEKTNQNSNFLIGQMKKQKNYCISENSILGHYFSYIKFVNVLSVKKCLKNKYKRFKKPIQHVKNLIFGPKIGKNYVFS